MKKLEGLLIFFLIIIIIFKFTKVKEGYGWIPLQTRLTRNMYYDLRGDPFKSNRFYYGSFVYKLFPYFHASPNIIYYL
jgi:hypothetical protein